MCTRDDRYGKILVDGADGKMALTNVARGTFKTLDLHDWPRQLHARVFKSFECEQSIVVGTMGRHPSHFIFVAVGEVWLESSVEREVSGALARPVSLTLRSIEGGYTSGLRVLQVKWVLRVGASRRRRDSVRRQAMARCNRVVLIVNCPQLLVMWWLYWVRLVSATGRLSLVVLFILQTKKTTVGFASSSARWWV